uniref:Uncharacterized protein n=1 Tax=Magallana gigas TaxID=29159 RepID=A0A8W8JB63_MAGGI
MRYKSIFDTISVVKECDEICPEFTMHYPFLLCLVCALSNAQLSEQNPVKPNTNTNQCKIWNEMLPKCEECNVGFFGINCSIPCRYPSYGNKCQSLCNCLEIDCHPATGCKDGLPTISSPAAVLISSKQGNTPELFTTNKIECPVGYTGNQCDIRCRYPSFGYLCQFACNCSKERCNFTKGCDVSDCSEKNNGSECEKLCQYPAFGVGCQSQCDCSEEYCDPLMGCNVSPTHCAADKRIKQNEAMFYITIVLGVWAAVQFGISRQTPESVDDYTNGIHCKTWDASFSKCKVDLLDLIAHPNVATLATEGHVKMSVTVIKLSAIHRLDVKMDHLHDHRNQP